MALRTLQDATSASDPSPSSGPGGRPDAAAAAKFAGQLERAAAEGRREGGLLAKGSAEFAALVKEQVCGAGVGGDMRAAGCWGSGRRVA
jgi:hypothetical protein